MAAYSAGVVRDENKDRYLRQVLAAGATVGARRQRSVLAAVATAVADRAGVDLRGTALARHTPAACVPAPPPRLATPELLGQVYEALRPRRARKASGAFYTPEAVARGVVDAVLGSLPGDPQTLQVCDPAVGGGAFLLAACRHLAARGADLRVVGRRGVYGLDVDPLAVEVTEAALTILAGTDGAPGRGHVRVGDALTGTPLPGDMDAVVGNPPFLSQLATATARTGHERRALQARFGRAARGYADSAYLFLLAGLDVVRDGGRVGLILPDSFLGARDAGPARQAVAERAALDWLWLAEEAVFDAGVRVCAPVFAVGGRQGRLQRRAGTAFETRGDAMVTSEQLRAAPSWSFLAADTRRVPVVACPGTRSLAEYCRATADFRDQFYGLVPYVFDEDPEHTDERGHPRLLTSGLIDPGRSLWGRRPARFAKRRFARPRVDVQRLRQHSPLAAWSHARQVPKVLVATQTRVLEAVVDEAGDWLPCTPVITVEAPVERLWHVAAALTAPPLTALALRACAGTALSADALKLGARQLTALPAPAEGPAWDAGAAALRAASQATDEDAWRSALEQAGQALCEAYGVGTAGLLEWWLARLPRRRGTGAPAATTAAAVGDDSVELHDRA